MEALVSPRLLSFPRTSNSSLRNKFVPKHSGLSQPNLTVNKTRKVTGRIAANISDVSAATDPAQVSVTWQIVVGAIAGVTPFVVAGIEFSKRIVAQRKCEECGGSGLVLIEKEYCRCPRCGGFLPWQSWRRFFVEFVDLAINISSVTFGCPAQFAGSNHYLTDIQQQQLRNRSSTE